MKKETIKNIISKNLVGQGNQVDLGSALPEILNGILDGISIEPFSYEDLKAKRDAGELVVGALYRITDYVATTIQSGTRSANHPFDLIVTAVTESELDAHAIAVPHDGDHYFDGFKLTAWDILYTLDNDDRYTWALTDKIVSSGGDIFYRKPFFDSINGDGAKEFAYWSLSDESIEKFTKEIKEPGTYDFVDGGDIEIVSFEQSTGKGVIYHMVDEFGNERQFDFKGIQFLRGQDWCEESKHESFVADVFDGVAKDWWLYALSWIAEDGTVYDVSLLGNSGALKNDEGRIAGCYDTKIGSVSAYDIYGIDGLFALDRNVMVSSYSYEGGIYYGTYGNQMGANCSDNTFGNDCGGNTFGNDCGGNTFGNRCSDNTFGDGCDGNMFGNGCSSNTFGVNCMSNTFGVNCMSNTFGVNCISNTFGNNANNVQYINVLNGVYEKTLTVATNVAYCQFVGLTTGGQVKVWNPAD